MPPITGRILDPLMICDRAEQSAGDDACQKVVQRKLESLSTSGEIADPTKGSTSRAARDTAPNASKPPPTP